MLNVLLKKHPLTPTVMTDKSGVQTAPNNPFLVFRRRTEKMQTRKVCAYTIFNLNIKLSFPLSLSLSYA